MSRSILLTTVTLLAFSLCGCGGSFSGVEAHAPAIQRDLVGTVDLPGEYTLYRGTGYIEDYDAHTEPLWTVSLQAGQKIGFRWVVDDSHKYSENSAFHLVAFAGGEARDLGSFVKRDVRFAWAGSHSNIAASFGGGL